MILIVKFSDFFFFIDILGSSDEIIPRRMPQNPFDDKSALVQVMAWCGQATSLHLKHC